LSQTAIHFVMRNQATFPNISFPFFDGGKNPNFLLEFLVGSILRKRSESLKRLLLWRHDRTVERELDVRKAVLADTGTPGRWRSMLKRGPIPASPAAGL